MRRHRISFVALAVAGLGLLLLGLAGASVLAQGDFLDATSDQAHPYDTAIRSNTRSLIAEGRNTFRYDTMGSEAFFGNTIGLHKTIEGAAFGGIGGGVSPKAAL